MKTLQNNFTTPEQSKRLLELGVPADSADCYYEKSASLSGEWEYKLYFGECVAIKRNLFSYRNGYVLPCWSVGRLIEIYLNSCKEMDMFCVYIICSKPYRCVDYLMSCFEEDIDMLDFSKLEE